MNSHAERRIWQQIWLKTKMFICITLEVHIKVIKIYLQKLSFLLEAEKSIYSFLNVI